MSRLRVDESSDEVKERMGKVDGKMYGSLTRV